MIISTERKEIKDFSLFKQKIDQIRVNNQVKLNSELINLCVDSISKMNNNYPLLKDEFSEALFKTIELIFNNILIDNSVIVSPLIWFANKYDNENILEICNHLTNSIFEFQLLQKVNKQSNTNIDIIEF